MYLSLVFIPLALVILFNLPFYKVSGKFAVFFASLFCFIQAVSVFFPEIAIMQISDRLNQYITVDFDYDGISKIMMLSTAIVAFCSIFVLDATETSDRRKFNFINLILLSIAGMNGLVFVRDIFSVYVFIEVIAAASYILIALDKNKFSLEGSFKYLIISSIATVMMLTSVALIFLIAGNTDFETVSKMYVQYNGNPLITVAVILFIVGLFIKGGVMPFHGWLPDAYLSSPASVSVFLAGIVTKTTGVYTIIRLFYSVFVFESSIQTVFLVFGSISIVFGALGAINQNNFKRMLAYSSISQVGYIIMALGAGTSLAFAAAIFHLFNHAIFKSLLFVNAAAVEKQTGISDMSMLGGLSYKMPVTSITSAVGFLSTAGIPPLSGFWSKLLIIIALWASGHIFFAFVAITASILTVTYFLIMQKKVFFGLLRVGLEHIKEAPTAISFISILLCGITIFIGLCFPFVLNGLIFPAAGF